MFTAHVCSYQGKLLGTIKSSILVDENFRGIQRPTEPLLKFQENPGCFVDRTSVGTVHTKS